MRTRTAGILAILPRARASLVPSPSRDAVNVWTLDVGHPAAAAL